MINSPAPPAHLERFSDFRMAYVDATRIARKHELGTRTHPIVNTAILGAFAKATSLIGIDSIVLAIREEVSVKRNENARAAREAYKEVKL